MVPLPRAAEFDELNERLRLGCQRRQQDNAGRQTETIGERQVLDVAAFRALPAAPFEACETRPAKVSSTSLVRYRGNDYSVPTTYGYHDVLVKGFVDEVVICHGSEVIARHRRSYERADFVFDPLHYLALLEQKTGAFDQAATVTAAVTDSIRPDHEILGAISFDAVKQLALCRLERRPARLDLSAYPHLPRGTVQTTAASDDMALLGAEAAA